MQVSREDRVAAEIMAHLSFVMPCAYCGSMMDSSTQQLKPTKDHIWPKRVRSVDNGTFGTVWSCYGCNQKKDGLMPDQWLDYMKREMWV